MSKTKTILTSKNTNRTIEDAISLVDAVPSTFKNWKTKETGLQLVLLGLAEVNALRISNLAGAVFDLESKVFDPENLKSTDPAKILELYKIATDAVSKSSDYVKSILASVNWDNLEIQLHSLAASEEGEIKGDSAMEVSRVAADLLKHLGHMKTKADEEETSE